MVLKMLQKVALKEKHIDEYINIVGEEAINKIKLEASPLEGVKLLHINATSNGGGVAEYLNSLVPLLRSLGIEVEWKTTIPKKESFFNITKNIHNGLQGKQCKLPKQSQELYLNENESFAKSLDDDYDIIIVHDPQPAAMKKFFKYPKAKWVWRCHIDTSHHNKDCWEFIRPFVEIYDALIFTMNKFIPTLESKQKIEIIPPSIDPLSKKNITIEENICKNTVSNFGIEIDHPYLLQVSRFDPWKDPLGVLEVYKKLKKEFPLLQLVLIGCMASDDPEALEIYNKVKEVSKKESNVYLLTNLDGVNSFEVNCFQRLADIVIQKSIREGFGLVVSESLWKKRPVVAGNTGGIPIQIKDGYNGFLADSLDDYIKKLGLLLRNKELCNKFGQSGKDHIKNNFLITNLIYKNLIFYKKLLCLSK